MTDATALIKIISKDFDLPDGMRPEQLRESMVRVFAYLIDENFPKLVQILYRADVDQDKLKVLLDQSDNLTTAEVIADAYIARQMAKVETWKMYSKPQ